MLVTAIIILIGKFILEFITEILDLRNIKLNLPSEFKDFFDGERYRNYQLYLKENIVFSLVESFLFTLICIGFILVGGFNFLDNWVRSLGLSELVCGLIFIGILFFSLEVIFLPFSIYKTFIIEEKYGFNKTTSKTFVLDIIKSWVLILIIGGLVLTLVLWLFETKGEKVWVYCWLGVSLFQLFLRFMAPVIIFPLFYKFTPIEEGELKAAIEDYAQKVGLKLKGIFKIDASRRTSKANAFFTGLGKYKRIALFDNLIQKLAPPEIVSVLAHEAGHLKKKHTLKGFIFSVITTGGVFYLFTFFLNNPVLFSSFGIRNLSVYLSLVLFTIFYIPLEIIFSILGNLFSRKWELEADKFSCATASSSDFVLALKKLTAENFSNLRPHPFKVFLYYSHPPILERIAYIKNFITGSCLHT
ncbi:MAG: M48 family metallopeptidase [Candidatus Omnitrophica bacterium]|nr:M48 family metallopeptidase [Candidatus Omnitrophota bacterium]